jgi:hypothetical protein
VSRVGLAVVVSIQFIALVTVCLLSGDNGWDDGAITLAFSRTFARHGVVALTPGSEIVEGFSSVAWFALNALVALARPSYHASILASQVLCALCVCATTALLGRTCALLRFDRLFSALTVITFAAWGCSFSEAANGMEMGLLSAAFLVMLNELLLPRPRLFLLGAGVVLAMTARFEAALYIALLALGVAASGREGLVAGTAGSPYWSVCRVYPDTPLGVVSVPGRRAFWCIVITALGTALLLTGWRLSVFSDVLPNTLWAKRWPPYAAFGVASRLTGAVELPSFFLPPLIALAALRLLDRRNPPRVPDRIDFAGVLETRRRALSILAGPILGAVLMGGVIGKQWGYYGRMPYFAFPIALLFLSLVLSRWVNAGRNKLRVAVAAGSYLASSGVSMMSFPLGALGAAFQGGSFGVTPHTYAESGQVFRRFASAADLKSATILTPDLGGLALCCDEFRLVDLGLLSNRSLAHRGHAALADVLETESPEMIEAHWQWASSGRLYELPTFRARYTPAFSGGTKLWVRRDVAMTIESRGRGCSVAADRGDVQAALRDHRYAQHDLPEDRTAFERPGVVLALNDADPRTANLCK